MSRPNGIEYSGRSEHIQFLGAPEFNLPGLFQLDNHMSSEEPERRALFLHRGVSTFYEEEKREGKRKAKTWPGLI